MNKTEKAISRRSFLKDAAVLGAGAALLGTPFALAAEAEGGQYDYEADVIIAGSGAGLLAACAAADAGCEVILLEKNAFLGGETIMNEAWINGVGTRLQEAEGVTDSPETYIGDYSMNHAAKLDAADMSIAQLVAERSGEAVNRLMDLGCQYKLNQDFQSVASVARAHILQPNAAAWATVLAEAAQERGVKIMMETALSALIANASGEIAGLVANGMRFKARKGVILATGDMSGNGRMRQRFHPAYTDMDACCPSNTGDGYFAAMALGADSSYICDVGPGPSQFFQPEGSALNYFFLSKGMIQVNEAGRRFGNELDYSAISGAQQLQPGSKAFGIFDARLAALAKRPLSPVKDWVNHYYAGESVCIGLISGVGSAFLEDFMEKGSIVEAATLEELAEKLGIDPEGLKAQAETWNASVKAYSDEEFQRPIFDVFQFGAPLGIEEGPFYGLIFSPYVRFMLLEGPNLLVDTDMRILDVEGQPIPRLYGAGAGLCAGTGTFYATTCGNHMAFNAVSALVSAENVSKESSLEA